MHNLVNLITDLFGNELFQYSNTITYCLICVIILIIAQIVLFIIPKKGKCCMWFLVIFVLFGFVFNQYMVEVNRFDIEMGLEKPIKIVQLSDIHYNTTLPYSINDAIKKCNKEKPDIVVITGDFKTNTKDGDLKDDCFKYLRHIRCEKIYAIYGNHDEFEDMDLMDEKFSDSNIVILEDDEVKLDKNLYLFGARYSLQGNIKKNLRKLPKNSNLVYLNHIPTPVVKFLNDSDNSQDRKILFLTGHTHGGQMVFPWQNKKEIAQRMFKIDYLDGLEEINGQQIYINKGIGSVYFPVRFGAKPEISVFNIK